MGSGGSKPEQHIFNAYVMSLHTNGSSILTLHQRCASEILSIRPRFTSTQPRGLTSPTTSPPIPPNTPKQSDSTRAQTKELNLQARVNAELTRVRDSQAQQLEDLTARLTINPEEPSSEAVTPPSGPTGFFSHLASPFYQDHSSIKDLIPGLSSKEKKDSGRSHDSVHMEIMELRQKLEARKKADKSSPEVEKAKESLVQCLRVNDRRPLDCWREVEQFKREVGKLERAFVERVGR
ncbi:MICOS complex subunit mic19-like [Teratosphaeria destructans]|uniref:MICOS complex subunit mic19-like n=1 Tax=Teratosphaeria destructans TaxID=418781 RepID=A0A9W7T1K8_9PEZI|nr:MICOS complex subunit mic19-like [Teratosphaeria destructans]